AVGEDGAVRVDTDGAGGLTVTAG
ncbi:MAG: hypothetical protein RJA51_1203, partial [Actinomycetota bacterium]